MTIVSVLAFFIIPWAYGFALLHALKASSEKHPFFQFLAEYGVGFAVFSLLGVIFGLLHVPLTVYAYIALAAVYPVFLVVKSAQGGKKTKRRDPEQALAKVLKSKSTLIAVLLLIIVGFHTFYFYKGAFTYDYLEDDDPWEHVLGIKYIAMEHTYDQTQYFQESQGSILSNYLEPYPPTYDIIMAMLHQLGARLQWTVKFFNVLMISLTLLFTFLFVKELFNDELKALFVVFVLAALPSFMSHFIWSQTLALMLFPVGLYAFLRGLHDKTWFYIAIVVIASEMVTQPVVSFLFGIVIIFAVGLLFIHEALANKGAFKKRFPLAINGFLIGLFGLLGSLVFWLWQFIKWSFGGIWQIKGEIFTSGWGGSYSSPVYTFKEVFFPPHASRIDQAVGWGPFIFIALVLGVILILALYRKTLNIKRSWTHWWILLWFVFTLYAVFASTWGLPDFGSSRWWAYLAFPLALIVAEGVFIIGKSISGKRELTLVVIVLIAAVLIGWTSIPAKIAVQTAMWPPGVHWTSPQQLNGFAQMWNDLPPDQTVYTLCGMPRHVIGFDQIDYQWNYDTVRFREQIGEKTGEEIVAFMDSYGYNYLIIDTACVTNLGPNVTQAIGERISATNRFAPEIQTDGFILARKT